MSMTDSRAGSSSRSTPVIRDRALTIVAAVIVGLVVWAIGRLILGHDVTALIQGDDEPTVIGPIAVAVATTIGGVVAWVALTLLERFPGRPARIFLILGVIVLALSLVGPLNQGEGTGSTIALIALHIAVGIVLIVGLVRTTTAPR